VSWRGGHVELERVRQVPRLGREERPRHGPAEVVHDDVHPAERIDRGGGQPRGRVEIGQVGGHHDGPPPGGLDLARHLGQLVLGARRDHHVRPGLGQGDGRGRADAAARAGHDGHAAGDAETIQDHRSSLPPWVGLA
jgi:hypothetical protein